MTEAPALAIVAEPMEACDAGNRVSPRRTVTFSGAQSEGVGGHLPHDRIGAGAEVVRAGLDERRTVAVQR